MLIHQVFPLQAGISIQEKKNRSSPGLWNEFRMTEGRWQRLVF